MMWHSKFEKLQDGRAHVFQLLRGPQPLRYGEVLELWQEDESFRTFFLGVLADAPFKCYRWETPPLTAATIDRTFEFALLDSPGLDREVEPQAFASHFPPHHHDRAIVVFANLSKDAVLVVPCPQGR